MRVAIFDDVLAARREVFHIPGLEVAVYGDADDVQTVCAGPDAPAVVCMDYAMGAEHVNGADAVRAVRAAGYRGRIVAMSSDPAANARMIDAGANEHLQQKAMLRSFLVALGKGARDDGGTVGANGSGSGSGGSGGGGEIGSAALGLLGLIVAAAAVVGGVGLVGPLGHHARYGDGLLKLHGRVLADGATPSEIDGAPAPIEAIAIWGVPNRYQAGKKDFRFELIAGSEAPKGGELVMAAGGARVRVLAVRSTVWHLGAGPARRLERPGVIPTGQGLAGLRAGAYVAKSRRVVAGQHIVVVGTRDGSGVVYASDVADEEHQAALGPDFLPSPPERAAGLGLLAAGGLLLGVLALRGTSST